MKVKVNFRIEEKEILLASMDHYIDALNRLGLISNNDNEAKSNIELTKILEARKKLILEMYPIRIHKEDRANQYIYDKWYSHCYLCDDTTGLTFPESPIINNHSICEDCFKHYYPVLYKKTCDINKRFWEEEDKFWENQLVKNKSENKELQESNLLEEDLPF